MHPIAGITCPPLLAFIVWRKCALLEFKDGQSDSYIFIPKKKKKKRKKRKHPYTNFQLTSVQVAKSFFNFRWFAFTKRITPQMMYLANLRWLASYRAFLSTNKEELFFLLSFTEESFPMKTKCEIMLVRYFCFHEKQAPSILFMQVPYLFDMHGVLIRRYLYVRSYIYMTWSLCQPDECSSRCCTHVN